MDGSFKSFLKAKCAGRVSTTDVIASFVAVAWLKCTVWIQEMSLESLTANCSIKRYTVSQIIDEFEHEQQSDEKEPLTEKYMMKVMIYI